MLRRVPIGPALVAVACWCASGQVTLPDATHSARLVIPAPAWVGAAAFLLAWLVPGWRRHPGTALPAVLTTLPWWPVPLPSIALLWTGPLAWAPILVSLLVALVATRPAPAPTPVQPVQSVTPRRQAVLAGVLTLAISAVTAWTLSPRLPTGDEPHYLVITQSLLRDGDLEIRNNHDARDYASYFAGELRPDYRRAGKNGEIYSVHAPGVSALVLPGFALFGYRGAQATVVVSAALAAAIVWWIGFRVTGSGRAAWVAWLAIACTPTFVIQSVTVFPDGPGAFASACAIWLIVTLSRGDRVKRSVLVTVSLVLAAMPWLHTRFAVLAGVLGATIVAQLLRRQRRLGDLVAFAAGPAAFALAWFAFFYTLYGTFNPTAPYGPPAGDRSWTFIPGGILGLLFDQQFGLAAYSPVLLVAALGFAAAGNRTDRAVLWAIAGAGLAYLAASSTYWMWWAGVPAPPARLATAALPCLTIPLALAWARLRDYGQLVATTALVWSLAIGGLVIAVGRGGLAWNIRDAQALWLEWLNPTVNLPRGWPSFFWRLTPGDVATEWPFAVHVVVWVGTLAAAAAATAGLARRARTVAGGCAVVAVGCLITTMAAVQIGWGLSGGPSLDPTASQLAAIDALQRGHSAFRIQSGRISRTVAPPGTFVVRPADPPLFRPELPAAWFDNVPSGRYDVRIEAPPSSGTVTVRADGSPEPLARFDPGATGGPVTLDLPRPVRRLSFEAATRLRVALVK